MAWSYLDNIDDVPMEVFETAMVEAARVDASIIGPFWSELVHTHKVPEMYAPMITQAWMLQHTLG